MPIHIVPLDLNGTSSSSRPYFFLSNKIYLVFITFWEPTGTAQVKAMTAAYVPFNARRGRARQPASLVITGEGAKPIFKR